jgi:hypothetical protein
VSVAADHDVFLTQGQLNSIENRKWTIQIIRLLEMLLDKQSLGESCCAGDRTAHNKKGTKQSKQLPKEIVAAIQGIFFTFIEAK